MPNKFIYSGSDQVDVKANDIMPKRQTKAQKAAADAQRQADRLKFTNRQKPGPGMGHGPVVTKQNTIIKPTAKQVVLAGLGLMALGGTTMALRKKRRRVSEALDDFLDLRGDGGKAAGPPKSSKKTVNVHKTATPVASRAVSKIGPKTVLGASALLAAGLIGGGMMASRPRKDRLRVRFSGSPLKVRQGKLKRKRKPRAGQFGFRESDATTTADVVELTKVAKRERLKRKMHRCKT